MNADTVPVTVRIMEKEFCVACPKAERDSLLESARFLDGKMREIHDSRKVVGMDRIAIICALNLAHELLNASHAPVESTNSPLTARVKNLHDKIEAALHGNRQLEL